VAVAGSGVLMAQAVIEAGRSGASTVIWNTYLKWPFQEKPYHALALSAGGPDGAWTTSAGRRSCTPPWT
jgi:hypothetical protein